MALRLILIAVLCAVCAPRAHEARARGPIILISVDTLRSDRLSIYGYDKNPTPHIEALRRDAVLYERAYSHAPLTLPSHVSMLTGLLPTEHAVRNNIGYRLDASKHRTLARTLRERGYRFVTPTPELLLRLRGTQDREDLPRTDIPILLVAGSPDEVSLEPARLLGADDVVYAPIEIEELALRLYGAVKRWRGEHPDRPWADAIAEKRHTGAQ